MDEWTNGRMDYYMINQAANNRPKRTLSKRELQVVELLYQGANNKRIAEHLRITERTVKFHCANIYQKYQVQSRIELLLKRPNT